MRPDTETNEEVPCRSGPEILAVGQDWTRRVQAGHAARGCDKESSCGPVGRGSRRAGGNSRASSLAGRIPRLNITLRYVLRPRP